MRPTRPVLVVSNPIAPTEAPGLMAVCVATLERAGRTASRHGSEAAGAAAVEFAHRLEGMLREGDQLIQIHEGKHCLLLRSLKDRNHASRAGLKLQRLFDEPFVFRGRAVQLEVLAGIACGRSEEADAEGMFRAAEAAREAARGSQKVFELADESVVADMRQRWQLNDELERALFEHQLKLYYQPKVSADGHRLCGAEGLIRWEHPDGLLSPAAFLPDLEPDKLRALNRHVIRQSIRDLAGNAWLPPVSINLDPVFAEDPELVHLIIDELALWDVRPERLVLEVTENGIVSNLAPLMEAFAELRSHGVRISMDDFGTGNCSLAQFRNLLVDELKIDRSFVLGRKDCAANRYLTGVIVELGHHFGMSVVAEGVETRRAAEDLKALGCDVLQGFYFSPPLPLEDLARWHEGRAGSPDCA